MGNPNAISLGAGTLFYGPLGSTEPSDLATGWASSWVNLGYTHDGNQFSYALDTDKVEVAEELDPLQIVATGRTIQVKFILAEITASNLKRALNGGTITSGAGFVTFDPPTITGAVRAMYGWQSDDSQERWVFRQCFSGGTVEINRRKGADKAGFAFELNLEKPAGVQPFKVIMASPARA